MSSAIASELQASEERLRLATTAANMGVWDWDLVSNRIWSSDRHGPLFGLAPGTFFTETETFLAAVHPEDRTSVALSNRQALDNHEGFSIEYRIVWPDGTMHWLSDQCRVYRDADDRPLRMLGIAVDITPRKLAEAQLHAEKERLDVTLRSIGDAVITTDGAGLVEYVNRAAEFLTGWDAAAAQGRSLDEILHLVHEDGGHTVAGRVASVISGDKVAQSSGAKLLVRRDGERVAVEESAALIHGPDGAATGMVVVFRDVTDARALQRKTSWQATHDPLTGLVNRGEFRRRVERAIATARPRNNQHTLLYLDLDQFKIVNDKGGHSAGDRLLQELAARLKQRLRDSDVFARLGGDEFGILLYNCPINEAEIVADKLRQTVQDLRFCDSGETFRVGVSIGAVSIDHSQQTVEAVISAADAATYLAKQLGRNRVCVYRPDEHGSSNDMQWAARLHVAIRDKDFVLYQQPIRAVASSTGSCHAEILLRMVDMDGTLVPPMAFIPAAERYGLMPAVDRWVIGTVLDALERPSCPLSADIAFINLSGATLIDPQTHDWLSARIAASKVDPGRIGFEMAETVAASNMSMVQPLVKTLRGLGCHMALDDFGSAMSSFTCLRDLRVDYLKIDGGFIGGIEADPINRAVVRAIADVGKALSIKTVAEWVEDAGDLQALGSIGIDYAQGFHLGKPQAFLPASKDKIT